MLNSIPGKDPCPNCGELLIGNSAPRRLGQVATDYEAICSVCKVSFNELERIEARRAISGGVTDGTNGLPRTGSLSSYRSKRPYEIRAVDRENRIVYVRRATWLEVISFKLLEWVKRKTRKH